MASGLLELRAGRSPGPVILDRSNHFLFLKAQLSWEKVAGPFGKAGERRTRLGQGTGSLPRRTSLPFTQGVLGLKTGSSLGTDWGAMSVFMIQDRLTFP